jgi:hypothetical protein
MPLLGTAVPVPVQLYEHSTGTVLSPCSKTCFVFFFQATKRQGGLEPEFRADPNPCSKVAAEVPVVQKLFGSKVGVLGPGTL